MERTLLNHSLSMQQGTKYGTQPRELDDSESWTFEPSTRDASYVAPMGERRNPTPLPEVDYELLSLRLPEIAPSPLPKLAIRPPPLPSPGQLPSRTQGPRESWFAAPPQRSDQLDDSELEVSVTEVTRERISPPMRSPSPPPRVKRALHRRLAWGGAGLLPCFVIAIALCANLAQQHASSAQREQAASKHANGMAMRAALGAMSSTVRAPAQATIAPAPGSASTVRSRTSAPASAPTSSRPSVPEPAVANAQPTSAEPADRGIKPRIEKRNKHRSKRQRSALAKRIKRGKRRAHHRRHHD